MRSLHDMLVEAANRPGPEGASRRHVLAALGVAGAAAPLAFGAGSGLAQVNSEGKNKNNKKKNKRKKKNKQKQNDIDILNYALTLEHLEYAFYRDGLTTYNSDAQFTIAGFPPGTYQRFIQIRDHEQTHVNALSQTISGLGGKPVAECTYNFGYTDIQGFVDTAQLLENTGVSAYDGALALINAADLQTTGATIATVEARHASYLNSVNGDDPFPAAFDTAKSQADILAAAGGFIVSCP
ncbi:MAG: ferritin-like domain-containing protein [Thermomicrobiales bacterium]